MPQALALVDLRRPPLGGRRLRFRSEATFRSGGLRQEAGGSGSGIFSNHSSRNVHEDREGMEKRVTSQLLRGHPRGRAREGETNNL